MCKYQLGPSPLTETRRYSSCAAFCVQGKGGGDTGVVDWMGHFVPSFSQNEKKKKIPSASSRPLFCPPSAGAVPLYCLLAGALLVARLLSCCAECSTKELF